MQKRRLSEIFIACKHACFIWYGASKHACFIWYGASNQRGASHKSSFLCACFIWYGLNTPSSTAFFAQYPSTAIGW